MRKKSGHQAMIPDPGCTEYGFRLLDASPRSDEVSDATNAISASIRIPGDVEVLGVWPRARLD